ncbi:Inosine triphosphate pyrophosphatase-like [Cryptosporidium tyzzeri]|nr:Inosine triphosphate pyrophosphatase-like [Cryptosporidium tyzzeri]
MKKSKVYLVSGNKKKAEEFLKILDGKLDIELVDIDLPEFQGSPEEIALHKCKSAYEKIKKPVFVEDTSLCFNAYNGLPGPYVKWFLKSVGAQGLYNMLEAYQDKSAYAMTLIGYYDETKMSDPIIFKGKIDGEIVKPRGEKGFSWDPIFKPNGYSLAFSEMDMDVKNQISHRYLCLLKVLVSFFNHTIHFLYYYIPSLLHLYLSFSSS